MLEMIRHMQKFPIRAEMVKLGSARSRQNPRFRQSLTWPMYDKVYGEPARLRVSCDSSDADPHVLRLLLSSGRQELIVPFTLDRVLRLEPFDTPQEGDAIQITRLPRGGELIRRSRHAVLEPSPCFALIRTRQARQEIGCRLLDRAVEAHIDEELPRLGGLAEEDLPALVQYANFIEEVVCRLGGLVDRDEGGRPEVLGA